MSHVAWIQQAESDLAAALTLSGAGHHSQAVWLAAQAVEKGHKAILLALGLRYEDHHFRQLSHKTADIAKLLPVNLQAPLDPQVATRVANLESRASTARYPSLPSRSLSVAAPASWYADSKREVEDAALLLGWCRERVERALRASQAMAPPQAPAP